MTEADRDEVSQYTTARQALLSIHSHDLSRLIESPVGVDCCGAYLFGKPQFVIAWNPGTWTRSTSAMLAGQAPMPYSKQCHAAFPDALLRSRTRCIGVRHRKIAFAVIRWLDWTGAVQFQRLQSPFLWCHGPDT